MDASNYLQEGERLVDLQIKGLHLIQNPQAFCFGTDAVLLANFVTVQDGATVVELGTGSGVILLLLTAKTGGKRFVGVEIQECMAQMAKRSVQLNALEEKVTICHMDLKDAPKELGYGLADVVVCNPPYGRAGASMHNESEAHRIARHEVCCTLDDCVQSASKLVRNGGRVAFIHQSDRIVDLIQSFVANKIEPKRIMPVQPFAEKAANLVLLEGVKLGKRSLQWLPTLVVWGEDGKHTKAMQNIYEREWV